MFRYALLRILGAIPTLFLVVAIAFLMVHAAPGGPFDAERALPPEIEKNIASAYHLDESLPQQFKRYISGLWRGDFGPSYRYRDYTVTELIANAFPVSMQLGLLAMLVALIVGISAGLIAALRRNTFLDRLLTGIAMSGISIPVFVVAPVLVLVFAVYLQWLPASWSGGNSATRLVLPVIALALPQIAYIARLVRGKNINETSLLATDYLNHFNEIIMLLDMIPSMPECLEDARGWVDLAGAAADGFGDGLRQCGGTLERDPAARINNGPRYAP